MILVIRTLALLCALPGLALAHPGHGAGPDHGLATHLVHVFGVLAVLTAAGVLARWHFRGQRGVSEPRP
jgi:hypothetical protein